MPSAQRITFLLSIIPNRHAIIKFRFQCQPGWAYVTSRSRKEIVCFYTKHGVPQINQIYCFLSFVNQITINNVALCQPGWRTTNAITFYDMEEVQSYWHPQRAGPGQSSTDYANLLRELGSKLVLRDDTYGIVQRGGSWSRGPPNLELPWVTKFSINELCHSRCWPPQDLARYLKLTRHSTTSLQRCEDATVEHGISVSDALAELERVGSRDRTLTMLAFSRLRSFRSPPCGFQKLPPCLCFFGKMSS